MKQEVKKVALSDKLTILSLFLKFFKLIFSFYSSATNINLKSPSLLSFMKRKYKENVIHQKMERVWTVSLNLQMEILMLRYSWFSGCFFRWNYHFPKMLDFPNFDQYSVLQCPEKQKKILHKKNFFFKANIIFCIVCNIFFLTVSCTTNFSISGMRLNGCFSIK